MSLPEKVSREEYDQTLRNSVNAYYEHAMKDPTMSQEEARMSAAEMAEQYLSAMEEYDLNADLQAQEVTGEETLDSAALDTPEAPDAGIDDGGMDDGIE